MNGDSKSTIQSAPSLVGWLVRWARRAGTRNFFPALAALVIPVQNIFFLAAKCFILCVPIAQQPAAGVSVPEFLACLAFSRLNSGTETGQAVVQGRLSLNVVFGRH